MVAEVVDNAVTMKLGVSDDADARPGSTCGKFRYPRYNAAF